MPSYWELDAISSSCTLCKHLNWRDWQDGFLNRKTIFRPDQYPGPLAFDLYFTKDFVVVLCHEFTSMKAFMKWNTLKSNKTTQLSQGCPNTTVQSTRPSSSMWGSTNMFFIGWERKLALIPSSPFQLTSRKTLISIKKEVLISGFAFAAQHSLESNPQFNVNLHLHACDPNISHAD